MIKYGRTGIKPWNNEVTFRIVVDLTPKLVLMTLKKQSSQGRLRHINNIPIGGRFLLF